MKVRLILGSIANEHVRHSIAKLENGQYAVGKLLPGQAIKPEDQFETLDAAHEYWIATLPLGNNQL